MTAQRLATTILILSTLALSACTAPRAVELRNASGTTIATYQPSFENDPLIAAEVARQQAELAQAEARIAALRITIIASTQSANKTAVVQTQDAGATATWSTFNMQLTAASSTQVAVRAATAQAVADTEATRRAAVMQTAAPVQATSTAIQLTAQAVAAQATIVQGTTVARESEIRIIQLEEQHIRNALIAEAQMGAWVALPYVALAMFAMLLWGWWGIYRRNSRVVRTPSGAEVVVMSERPSFMDYVSDERLAGVPLHYRMLAWFVETERLRLAPAKPEMTTVPANTHQVSGPVLQVDEPDYHDIQWRVLRSDEGQNQEWKPWLDEIQGRMIKETGDE